MWIINDNLIIQPFTKKATFNSAIGTCMETTSSVVANNNDNLYSNVR